MRKIPGKGLFSTKLLIAIAVVQLIFWLLFNPIFIQPQSGPFERFDVTSFEFAKLKSPVPENLKTANFQAYEPKVELTPAGYYATRTSFTLAEIPKNGIEVLDRSAGDNIRVYANGNFASGQGEMILPEINYFRVLKKNHYIPAALLKKGENSIDTILVFGMTREAYLPKPTLAEHDSFNSQLGWVRFLQYEVHIISITIGSMLSLFLLVTLLRSEKKEFLLWIFLLTASWTGRSIFFFWPNIPIHGEVRALYYALVTLLLSACWPIFVDKWTNHQKNWLMYSVLASFALGAAMIIYWLMFSDSIYAFSHTEAILDILGLTFMAVTLARLLWHFARFGDDRYWEAAFLILMGLLTALFLINNLVWNQNVPYLNMSQPLFLLFFIISFYSRNFRLFQSTAQINARLETQLEIKTSDLELSHSREKELVRERAHGEERQRIMRDMHDGLGSSLMSMLFAARNGDANPKKVADGLQHVIDEMRLMIDSMDSVGDSLTSALGTFRNRVQGRVENAGFKFEWQEDAVEGIPTLGPREALQVFRIMQEAVANALRHSEGNTISITTTNVDALPGSIRIEISDNGIGIQDDLGSGYGLDNMKTRAAAIGANISFSKREPQGTSIMVDIVQQ